MTQTGWTTIGAWGRHLQEKNERTPVNSRNHNEKVLQEIPLVPGGPLAAFLRCPGLLIYVTNCLPFWSGHLWAAGALTIVWAKRALTLREMSMGKWQADLQLSFLIGIVLMRPPPGATLPIQWEGKTGFLLARQVLSVRGLLASNDGACMKGSAMSSSILFI